MSVSRSLILSAFATVSLMIMAACSPSGQAGGSAAPAASGSFDPCAVLSPADAETVFGGPAKPPTPTITADTVFQCVYSSEDGSQLVSILIRRAASAAENSGIFDQIKSASPATMLAVTGLGEDAYFDTTLTQLGIKQGVYWVILSGKVSGDLQAALTGIAPAVIARLP
jgi:hypothetical protein